MKRYLLFGLFVIMTIILTSCQGINSQDSSSVTGAIVAAPVQSVVAAPVQQYCDRQVPSTTTEQVCEQVPYECEKECQKSQTIQDETPYSYIVSKKEGLSIAIPSQNTDGRLRIYIYNGDPSAGYFKVKFKNIIDGKEVTETIEQYVKSQETVSFASYRLRYDLHGEGGDNAFFDVISPTRDGVPYSYIVSKKEAEGIAIPSQSADGRLRIYIYNGDPSAGYFKVKFKNIIDSKEVTETIEQYVKSQETLSFASYRLRYCFLLSFQP